MNLFLSSIACAVLLCSPVAAQEGLTLLAEDNFPNNYLDKGELKGLSVDLLKETFKRAEVPYTVAVLPWARAYDTALKEPGNCVFSTAHTPERDSQFKWIGPLSTIEMIVVASRTRPIEISSDGDLGRYTIGTYLGDYRESVLKGMGMHIESVREDMLNAEKLRRGRIDLWAIDSARLPGLKGEFIPTYTFYKVDLALACNAATDARLVDRLRLGLDNLRQDGSHDRVRNVYQAQ